MIWQYILLGSGSFTQHVVWRFDLDFLKHPTIPTIPLVIYSKEFSCFDVLSGCIINLCEGKRCVISGVGDVS